MRTSTRRGWVRIDDATSVCLRNGQPLRIRTTSTELQRIEQQVARWVGAALKFGGWVRFTTWSRVGTPAVYEAECGLAQAQPGNKDWN